MVVHLQHTSFARAAVMRAIWLHGVAFLAVPRLPVRLCSERCVGGRLAGREGRVALAGGRSTRRAGVLEDGDGIAGCRKPVEDESNKRSGFTCEQPFSNLSHHGTISSCVDIPVHFPSFGQKPMLTSTHAAQVNRPYTNARGKYPSAPQQHRSTLLAQLLRRRLNGGDDEGDISTPVRFPYPVRLILCSLGRPCLLLPPSVAEIVE